MAKERDTTPIWGYRLKDGEIESKIFEGKIPQGWKDTPASFKTEEE